MLNLISMGSLFDPDRVFIDSDTDGYVDSLDLELLIDPGMESAVVWTGVLNLVARLAFETISLDTIVKPSTHRSDGTGHRIVLLMCGQLPPGYTGELSDGLIWRNSTGHIYIGGTSDELVASILNTLSINGSRKTGIQFDHEWEALRFADPGDGQLKVSGADNQVYPAIWVGRRNPSADSPHAATIENNTLQFDPLDLSEKNGFYAVRDGNPRARVLKTALLVEQPQLTNQLGIVLAGIVSQMVLEATQIELPVVYYSSRPASDIVIHISEGSTEDEGVRFIQPRGGEPFNIRVSGDHRSIGGTLQDWFNWGYTTRQPACQSTRTYRERIGDVKELISGTGFWGSWLHYLVRSCNHPVQEIPPLYSEKNRNSIQAAVDALNLPGLPPLARRKPVVSRHEWKSEVAVVLELVDALSRGEGHLSGTVLVSRPRQQREDLRDQIESLLVNKGYEPTVAVLNSYKPGLSWLLEQVLPGLEAIDQIGRIELSYQPFPLEPQALETESRWLQEIFPGPDILEDRLSLPTGSVSIRRTAGIKEIYQVTTWNAKGEKALEMGFSPRYLEMPYLGQDLDSSTIHPSTSGIRLHQNGQILLEQTIDSDRVAFWRIYQDQWLPLLSRSMTERLKEQSGPESGALWREIRFEVALSETEQTLDFETERISPMEALHEDLYFATLDFFDRFMSSGQYPAGAQLGQVIPKVSIAHQDNTPSAALVAEPFEWDRPPLDKPGTADAEPGIVGLGLKGKVGFVDFDCRAMGFDQPERHRAAAVLNAWGFDCQWLNETLRFRQQPVSVPVVQPAEPREITKKLPRDRYLTLQEVSEHIRQLSLLPTISTWIAGHSWKGRPIPVIEAYLGAHRSRQSIAKLRLLKPTLLLVGRHHANEISGTSATLDLAYDLTTTPTGQDILKRVNVVMIPVENPDGVVLLEELMQGCRGHKLHAARYNAIGAEYYAEYFKKHPRCPEAQAKTTLWNRWLPEIVIDQHGVPDHEWDQPFAGVIPYRFREFWIPRTFAYAYLPFISTPDHPNHASACRIRDVLRNALNDNSAVRRQSNKLSDRYRRYARGPEPAVFPDLEDQTLLTYPLLERVNKTNCAVRFPDITQSEIILELPDETVEGEGLERCVEAIGAIHKAILNYLERQPGRLTINTDPEAGRCTLTWQMNG